MKIHSLMIENPITIKPNASVAEAIELMKTNSIRHLPVVTTGNKLQGFLTLADMKQGLIPSMLGDISMDDLMIKNPITVSPDDDIEFAAQLIYNHKIGGMPVVKKGRLVGIVTATDMLRTFIDMMGILSTTSRIDVVLGDQPAAFKKAMQIINDNGGDIINVRMTPQRKGKRVYYFRLSACKTQVIKKALESGRFEVLAAMD
ncbi:MAG: CBS domain-containing protein [Desulfobacterales bacterium]|jgi:acetoin utilization protein AcuB|nr:CBS domain-containing protein [Desulfobacterales bacterium]